MTRTRIVALTLSLAGVAGCNGGNSTGASAQSLGQTCATDSDCGKVEQCTGGRCIPRVDIDAGTIGLCTTNGDCGAGQVCEIGVCLPHQLGDGGVTLCHDDTDCASGDHCLAGVCLPSTISLPPVPMPPGGGPATGIGQPCSSSASCSGGLNCAFGVCLPVDVCATDSDCNNGQKCLKGICI